MTTVPQRQGVLNSKCQMLYVLCAGGSSRYCHACGYHAAQIMTLFKRRSSYMNASCQWQRPTLPRNLARPYQVHSLSRSPRLPFLPLPGSHAQTAVCPLPSTCLTGRNVSGTTCVLHGWCVDAAQYVLQRAAPVGERLFAPRPSRTQRPSKYMVHFLREEIV